MEAQTTVIALAMTRICNEEICKKRLKLLTIFRWFKDQSMKQSLFSNEEYSEVLSQLDQLMQEAEQLTDVDQKVMIYNILQYFDSIHREPLSRIFNALADYPSLRDQVLADPTTSKMFSLYDLVSDQPTNGHQAGQEVAFIPSDSVGILTPIKNKDWLELGPYDALENNKLYAKNYERVNFLVSRIDAEVYAIQNQCDGSFLPMDQGQLEDHILTCPWHGCKYDIRTGESIDQTKKLETYPVEIEEDGILKVEIAY